MGGEQGDTHWTHQFTDELKMCARAGFSAEQIAAILNLVFVVTTHHFSRLLTIAKEYAEREGEENE